MALTDNYNEKGNIRIKILSFLGPAGLCTGLLLNSTDLSREMALPHPLLLSCILLLALPGPAVLMAGGVTFHVTNKCPFPVTASGGAGKKATVVACRSACLAFGLDAFCCRGAYGTAETCRSSVYSRLFRDACPAYYSYAYDVAAATARCYAQEYVVTFCPSRWGDPVAQI
ncbi:hypothetical protein TRIUR3_05853 [Triticum urartu]|uniref:Uncharacterized protein n=2 Tax=Triticum TaxID=4564 RepID=A0A9R0Q2C0_TRITD|nr:hypothetical protein TRIUR3_05853 [Triticum urartu]VAH02325.1 unnamed protein product [Triticum turgidum subsp. durum]